MPERLKAILDKITAWWKKFNTKQRSVLISIVAVVMRPDFDPSKVCIRVISNRAASKEDGSIVFNKINSVVMQFLNGSLEYLGYVPSDAMVEKAVRQQKILSIYDPTSKAARSFEEIAKRLLDNESAALDEKRTISHVFSNFFNRKQ